eukprot:TRINITY_DN66338_c0_g1_i1.p1 TRINITY_DN66338_c0_g1~~TRINITY_DN66338_c0_g1_i1.p1  ORF type:complete len:786 (+),score=170.37 TRINITY_DN66338_c0_g1_i1:79-2436(+)
MAARRQRPATASVHGRRRSPLRAAGRLGRSALESPKAHPVALDPLFGGLQNRRSVRPGDFALPVRPRSAPLHPAPRLSETSDAAAAVRAFLGPLLSSFTPVAITEAGSNISDSPGAGELDWSGSGAQRAPTRLSGLTHLHNEAMRYALKLQTPEAADRPTRQRADENHGADQVTAQLREQLSQQCDQLIAEALRVAPSARPAGPSGAAAVDNIAEASVKSQRKRRGRTVYYCSGHEVYTLPAGMTRARAAEEVVLRRLQLLADDPEEQKRLQRQSKRPPPLSPTGEELCTSDDIIKRNARQAGSHTPLAASRRRAAQRRARERARLRAARHRVALEDEMQARNEYLADKQFHRRKEAERKEQQRLDEEACREWLPLLVWRRFCDVVAEAIVQDQGQKILQRRKNEMIKKSHGRFMAPVTKRRSERKRKAWIKLRMVETVATLLTWLYRRRRATARVYACLSSHGGQMWYRMRQFRFKVLHCQRFVRWCADQQKTRFAVLLLQYNKVEERVLEEQGRRRVQVQRQGGAAPAAAASPKAAGRRPQSPRRSSDGGRRSGADSFVPELNVRPPTLLAPKVPFNIKREVLLQTMAQMDQEFRSTFREWQRMHKEWEAEARREQVRLEAASLLHATAGEPGGATPPSGASRPGGATPPSGASRPGGSSTGGHAKPAPRPKRQVQVQRAAGQPARPRLPRCLLTQRMGALVERAMRMQDQVECGWQIEADKRFNTVRDRERDAREKAKNLYLEERLKEIDFLRKLDAGITTLRGKHLVPMSLLRHSTLCDER